MNRYTHHAKMFGHSVQSYASGSLVFVDLQVPNGSADALKGLTVDEAEVIRDLLDYAIRDLRDCDTEGRDAA